MKEKAEPIVELVENGITITQEIVKGLDYPNRVDLEYNHKAKTLAIKVGTARRISPLGGRFYRINFKGFIDMLKGQWWFDGEGLYRFEIKDKVLTILLGEKIC